MPPLPLPTPTRVAGVHVAWHRDPPGSPGPDGTVPDPLARHITSVLGPGEVRTGRLCPRCGSSAHGRPWARHPSASHLFVSLARAGGYAVTVLSLTGHLGVDLEEVAAVARGWDGPGGAALLLAPGELDADLAGNAQEAARTWAAKEATLKRRGVGLHTPPSQVRLSDETGLHDLSAPPGLVAVLAAPLTDPG